MNNKKFIKILNEATQMVKGFIYDHVKNNPIILTPIVAGDNLQDERFDYLPIIQYECSEYKVIGVEKLNNFIVVHTRLIFDSSKEKDFMLSMLDVTNLFILADIIFEILQ